MLTGLAHAHKYLGYLTFALTFVSLGLAIAAQVRKSQSSATWLYKCHRFGTMLLGRLTVAFGLGLFAAKFPPAAWLAKWPLWTGLLLWGAIEPIGKRMVTQSAKAAMVSQEFSWRPAIGVLIELLLLTTAIGLMTMSRLGKL